MNNEKADAKIIHYSLFTYPNVNTDKSFYDALSTFRSQVPTLIDTLRKLIEQQKEINLIFQEEVAIFFDLCRKTIHLHISEHQIYEMLIQHILTEDMFIQLFDDADFYRFNPIAHQLKKVIATFLSPKQKNNLLQSLETYYQVIALQAAQIQHHKQRQGFLKTVYENFYIACNPKISDKLGVVYTPNEIVHFMIESAENLTNKHFKKSLSDKNVEILDPATGTGTFIVELLNFLQSSNLDYKYKHEIFANEIAILPYYIANLNIEYTYKQGLGKYEPFLNTSLEDTLETRSTSTKLSVIIGNPPYNANQQSENDNNKNHSYPFVDARIKETYIKNSTAQKTKQYDMYKRFIRWSSDRIAEKGLIAFIVNRSFIDKRQDDGFRASVAKEFEACYILDLGGDVRNGNGAKGNVFGIMLGVAIIFLVKKKKKNTKDCQIKYFEIGDHLSKKEKLDFLRKTKIENIPFVSIKPDEKNNWIHQSQNDWESLIPLCNRATKTAKKKEIECAIFKTYTTGINTARDGWVYDFDATNLEKKIRYFIEIYNKQIQSGKFEDEDLDYSIKWSNTLKRYLRSKKEIHYQSNLIIQSIFRPFIKKYFYAEKYLNDRLTKNHYQIFGKNLNQANTIISVLSGMRQSFSLIANNLLPNLAFYTLDPAQNIAQFIIDKKGNRSDNITDWALLQFQNYYVKTQNIVSLQKEDIFQYIYGVLHNPEYRKKYEQSLKNDFPRIPFYDDFYRWVNFGKELLDLHLNFDTIEAYPLFVKDVLGLQNLTHLKVKLKANKEKGEISIDELTTLSNIPCQAWEYQLGNRSALEWILDQYKERKLEDTNYQLGDYKDFVIDLLKKVTTVSLKTVEIIHRMSE